MLIAAPYEKEALFILGALLIFYGIKVKPKAKK